VIGKGPSTLQRLRELGPTEGWVELDRLTPIFLESWQAIRAGAPLPATESPSLLEIARELAYRMLAHCNFCPWDCRVDRVAGAKLGACKLASGSRVSSHFHHTGEELFYRGTQGSGTIFFTSCNMRCAFCQNGDISTDKDNGEETDPRTLAAMAWMLRREGCHNINWVGGEVVIHLHAIVDAIALLGRDFIPTREELKRARRTKADRFFGFDELPDAATYDGAFNAPMLWNSNFFITLESMKILRLLTDVWLPDFKFGPGRCAMTLAKTPWYWETVTRNIALIAKWGEDLSIRHLVMPNHVECCNPPGAGMDCRARAIGAGERDGPSSVPIISAIRPAPSTVTSMRKSPAGRRAWSSAIPGGGRANWGSTSKQPPSSAAIRSG